MGITWIIRRVTGFFGITMGIAGHGALKKEELRQPILIVVRPIGSMYLYSIIYLAPKGAPT